MFISKTDCTLSHYEGYLWLITGSVTPNQPAALKQCYSEAGGSDPTLLSGS